MLLSAVSCAFFFKRFEGKMGNNREAREIRKKAGENKEKLGSTLGTAAGRDTVDHAGVCCGAGHGGSRWGPVRGGTRWSTLWRKVGKA